MKEFTYQFLSVQEKYFKEKQKEDWKRKELVSTSNDIHSLQETILKMMDEDVFKDLIRHYQAPAECKMDLKKRWEKARDGEFAVS